MFLGRIKNHGYFPSAMELIYFASGEDLRFWLEENYHKGEVWIGIYKSSSRRKGITYKEAVEETACFGWVEGIRKNIDAESYKMRFTPRKPNSIWSLKNLDRAERLLREGRMHPEGIKTYENRNPERTERYSYERENPYLSADMQARFEAEAAAWDFFQTLSPSIRKTSLWWVVQAKRETTREKRFKILLESCQEERKIPLLRREGE